MHTRFEATVFHEPGPQVAQIAGTNPDEITIDDLDAVDDAKVADSSGEENPVTNPDEIKLDDEEEDVVAPPPPPPRETKFLALDKCLTNRKFLEVY